MWSIDSDQLYSPPSANGEMDAFIDDLMAKMTLTEKVGQLNLSGGAFVCIGQRI